MSTHLVSNNVNYQLIILKCIIITVGDSNIVLNLTCNGDLLPLTTQTTPSPTATTTTTTLSLSQAETTLSATSSTTSKQYTTNITSMTFTATSIPSKAATMSSKEVPSTYNPEITTVQSQSTAAPSSVCKKIRFIAYQYSIKHFMLLL